jgi:serine/threonine protein kinase
MHRYTTIKKIGAGSFGSAYLCRRNDTGEKVRARACVEARH